jgi:aspartyl aminopeptidase
MEYKTAWKKYTAADLEALEALNAGYKTFLDKGKTERECVTEAVKMAEAAGYIPLETALKARRRLGAGDKIYAVCMNKALALFQLGEEPLENGMNILGAHIDSPRVDVKQNPLYENEGQAYLDTHYYGGIKKYQWVAQPMAIHGALAKKDGTVVDVVIGEDENDPVLVFSDLLIHLAGN